MAITNKLEDNVLIELLRYKKESAIELIYRQYWKELYVYAFALCANSDLTEDLLQETFLNLWKYREQLHINDTITGYLKTMVKNLYLKWANKTGVSIAYTEDEMKIMQNQYYEENTYEKKISYNDLNEKIQVAIAKMPKQMKEIFILRKEHGLSYRHISEKINIKESTVKKQLYYAMKIIKKHII